MNCRETLARSSNWNRKLPLIPEQLLGRLLGQIAIHQGWHKSVRHEGQPEEADAGNEQDSRFDSNMGSKSSGRKAAFQGSSAG